MPLDLGLLSSHPGGSGLGIMWGAFRVDPGSCGGCSLYRVWAPLAAHSPFLGGIGLVLLEMEFRIYSIGHFGFQGSYTRFYNIYTSYGLE